MPVCGLTLTLRPLGQFEAIALAPTVELDVTVHPTSMPMAACNSPQKSLATDVVTRLLSTCVVLEAVLIELVPVVEVEPLLLAPEIEPELTRNSDDPFRSDDGYATE
jgi:hypothetical protein